MKKVYITRNYKTINSAGGKAKTDIEEIIKNMGYENIGMSQSFHTNKLVDFLKNFLGIIKSAWCMPFKGILFMQYPMKKYYKFVCFIAHLKKTKVITLIHDLGSFRRQKLNPAKEINRLNHADFIIAQNPKMYDWLQEHQYQGRLGVLEIFDYLSSTRNNSGNHLDNKSPYVVNYAGALSKKKNSFLYMLGSHTNMFNFHLYGNGFQPEPDQKENSHFVYKGFQKSEDLIASTDGDFGLVWDGDSLYTCSGNFGAYLKYNSPHKISLYIRCHLPVIIWKDAAMASFIEAEKIGFSIHSLVELDTLLANMTREEYHKMKINAVKISERLASGYYVKKSVLAAETYLCSK